MRKIGFIFVPVIIAASVTVALAQTGGASGGGAAGAGSAAGGHTGGVTGGSPGAGTSGKLGSGTPNGSVQQHPTEPGCPGSAIPSTNPATKPPC
jgi:hypothetical protein